MLIKKVANSDHISGLKSKGLADESIKPPAASNNSLAPALNHSNTKLQLKFYGHCLREDKVTFTYKQLVNLSKR